MSVDKYPKLQTGIRVSTSIQKKKQGIQQMFSELKFNKKKPKYNYHSGLVGGMLVNQLKYLKPLVESKQDFTDIIPNMLESLVDGAKILVESYNWKLEDLNNLAEQFFGEHDEE